MNSHHLSECRFLIPLTRDTEISDGSLHAIECWQWLREELVDRFGGWTVMPGLQGEWKSTSTGKTVADHSHQYTVAVADEQRDELRMFLKSACVIFAQQCLYLSIEGRVEFVSPDRPSTAES